MANIAHIDVYAGEDRTIDLVGRDEFNMPFDLTDRSIAWYVGRSPFRPDDSGALISKSGTVIDASLGAFTVPVASYDTTDLNGDFEHMAIASDSTTRAVICQGRFRIRPTIGP